MATEEERRARRILEVSATAGPEEIHRAYQLMMRIHGRSGAAFAAPGMDEFSAEARQAILEQIEAAHDLLGALGAEAGPAPAAAPAEPEPEPAAATTLRRARDAAGFTLDQVAAETNVRREYLSALEEERFEHLRLATVNVRGYLAAYVHAIGLDEDQVVPAYMMKYREWQSQRSP